MKAKLLVFFIIIALLFTLDVSRSPQSQLSAKAFIQLVEFYQSHLSRITTKLGSRCKFTPTCSDYTKLAVAKFGTLKGGKMSAVRLYHCSFLSDHPGGYDHPYLKPTTSEITGDTNAIK